MKFLSYGKDGGNESTVWGYWFVEIKPLFSVALLCFENGSREAYHTHAFNSISWVLKGALHEDQMWFNEHLYKVYPASFNPVFTARLNLHKVSSVGRTWVLTFRGPWRDRWLEWLPDQKRFQTLTHGRKVIA